MEEKSIIKKLGITQGDCGWYVNSLGKHPNNDSLERLEICWSKDTECVCDTVYEMADARLIATAPEMLEFLIKHAIGIEEDCELISLIEKACYPKKWEEIKELL